MKIKNWLILILIPLLCELSMFFIGGGGIILVNIAYFPLSWIGRPFFICNSEIGCYPSNYGRIFMIIVYSLIYFIYCFVKKHKKEDK